MYSFLVDYQINMDLTSPVTEAEARVRMALSQVYMEWEKKTRRESREQGREQERRSTISEAMTIRYGSIDADLEALIPQLMQVSPTEYMRLLFELSKEDLIQHFKTQN